MNAPESAFSKLIVAFLIFCCLNSFSAAEAGNSFQTQYAIYKLLSDANNCTTRSDSTGAVLLLTKAASYDPSPLSSDVHAQLAYNYHMLNKHKQAISEYELALKFNPNYDEALYEIAMCYCEMKQYDQAIEYQEKYIARTKNLLKKAEGKATLDSLKDKRVYDLFDRGYKALDKGKVRNAVEWLELAAKYDPSEYSDVIHSNLGIAYVRKGEPEKGIVESQKALKLDPQDKYATYNLAIAHHDLGQFGEAINWLIRTEQLETDPLQIQRVREFIQDLRDDADKTDPASLNLPDYYDDMLKDGDRYRWSKASLPIKVFVPASSSVKGYKPQYRDYVLKCFDTWCLASGERLDYKLVDDKKQASIIVQWVSTPLTLREFNRNREKAGITHVNPSWDGSIRTAVIDVKTIDYQNEELADGQAFAVVMHEIGHALGLGHSKGFSDVMYYSSSSKQKGMPTSRDKATVVKMYKDYKKLAFTPKAPSNAIPSDLQDEAPRPPLFLPPKTVNDKLPPPPMFMPPPPVHKTLPPPPVFTPPPVSANAKKPERETKVTPPMFTPPPLAK